MGNEIKTFLDTDNTRFNKGLKEAEKTADKTAASIEDSFSGDAIDNTTESVEELTSGFNLNKVALGGLVTVVAAGAAGLAVYTKNSVAAANAVSKFAINTDISVENISSMLAAVKQGGGDITDLADITQDFTERLADARSGNETFGETFRALGVDITKTNDEAFSDTIKSLSEMEDQGKAMFRGIELFSDQYKIVASQLAQGNNILEKSPLFNNEFVENSAIINDNVRTMGIEIQTTLNESMTPFITALAEISTNMMESEGFENFLGWINTIGKAVGNVATFTAQVSKGMRIIDLEEEEALVARKRVLGMDALNDFRKFRDKAIVEQNEFDRKSFEDSARLKEIEYKAYAEEVKALDKNIVKERRAIFGDAFVGIAPPVPVVPGKPEIIDPNADIDTDIISRTEAATNLARDHYRKRIALQQAHKESEIAIVMELFEARQSVISAGLATEIDLRNAGGALGREFRLNEITSEINEQFEKWSTIGNIQFEAWSNIADMKTQMNNKEIERDRKNRIDEIKEMKISDKEKSKLVDQANAEANKKKKEQFEKDKKLRIAQAWMNTGSAVMGAWNAAMQMPVPPPVQIGFGIASTALLGAMAGIQTGLISKQEFGHGGIAGVDGIIGGTGGGSQGVDNVDITVGKKEAIITVPQQIAFTNAMRSGNFGNSKPEKSKPEEKQQLIFNIPIENFSAADGDIAVLEDMLLRLISSNRLSDKILVQG